MVNFYKKYFVVVLLFFILAFLFFYSNWSIDIDELAEQEYIKANLVGQLPPKEFKSDGCTLWPDSNWVECCIRHDIAYWKGGTSEERKNADIDLGKCITEKGHPLLAYVTSNGVRVTGVGWLPTYFRWGFGWDYPQTSFE